MMNFDAIHLIALCFLLSVCISWLTLLTQQFHGDFTADQLQGPQKIHQGQVPRIGGVAILISLSVISLMASPDVAHLLRLMLISILPVFLSGIFEDISGKISPLIRLLASYTTGLIFVLLTTVMLTRTGFGFADQMLSLAFISIFLTALAIASLSNAINVIDGLNGLSIGSSAFMALGIAVLGYIYGDYDIVKMALFFLAAIIGVGVFNFPFGHIFVGDGGAYLMGGFLAMLSILLPERNIEISPFASLLIIAYPFYELLRSMARRLLIGRGAMHPDNKHLHSVIYHYNHQYLQFEKRKANIHASMRMLLVPVLCVTWAVIFAESTWFLLIGGAAMIFYYETQFRIFTSQDN